MNSTLLSTVSGINDAVKYRHNMKRALKVISSAELAVHFQKSYYSIPYLSDENKREFKETRVQPSKADRTMEKGKLRETSIWTIISPGIHFVINFLRLNSKLTFNPPHFI